ncbi:hypothetical protein FPCIR_10385 [Fusarium pseudocircinatum]|uniref:Uncharacterized protein n=1 Tax=Fusarium pseudocircinatum TaxID=56676 RepID=A0A8H5KXD8_9HYPO|nr:hypothetical protein FPCIR_10385 [Fusarium pseudocircinatum]
MTVPAITVSFPNAAPESPMTRAVTSPVEWDHYYSGTRLSENQDIKMNGPQDVEYGGTFNVEEEGLDENFVYSRLSPVAAPRRDSKTLSELNGYLPGYQFVGSRDAEMDEAGEKYEGSFHEFTLEYPFFPAEDFESFSGCWREDDYEADVSESCFEESSEESSDTGGSSEDDSVSYTIPQRLSDVEDICSGLRKRKFDEYEQGQIEADEFEEGDFYEDESEDVRLEEPCLDPSDDEMDLEDVLECGCCSDFYFNSIDALHDHQYSLEDLTFQNDDIEIEELPRRLQTIPEVDETGSTVPSGYAEHAPDVTYVPGGFGAENDVHHGERIYVIVEQDVSSHSWPDEIVPSVEEEEGEDEDEDEEDEEKDDNGPYFNDVQFASAEVKYTFV